MMPKTTNDSGMPRRPVTAKLLGTPPASTVSGAEAAMIMKTRETVPMRRESRPVVVGWSDALSGSLPVLRFTPM